jgi:hypothetical protein
VDFWAKAREKTDFIFTNPKNSTKQEYFVVTEGKACSRTKQATCP